MKKISLREFKDMCEALSLTNFIFSTCNQGKSPNDIGMFLSLSFTKIAISFNPNVIDFQNNNGSISLHRVKNIVISEEHSLLGIIFTIICGDFFNDSRNVAYTFVAR